MMYAQIDEFIKEFKAALENNIELSSDRVYFGKCLVAQEDELKNLSKRELEETIKKLKKESLMILPPLKTLSSFKI